MSDWTRMIIESEQACQRLHEVLEAMGVSGVSMWTDQESGTITMRLTGRDAEAIAERLERW